MAHSFLHLVDGFGNKDSLQRLFLAQGLVDEDMQVLDHELALVDVLSGNASIALVVLVVKSNHLFVFL